jgi:uncharacterized membrane protein YoaK (UPF0700 family)
MVTGNIKQLTQSFMLKSVMVTGNIKQLTQSFMLKSMMVTGNIKQLTQSFMLKSLTVTGNIMRVTQLIRFVFKEMFCFLLFGSEWCNCVCECQSICHKVTKCYVTNMLC